jgi:hypothetical protein
MAKKKKKPIYVWGKKKEKEKKDPTSLTTLGPITRMSSSSSRMETGGSHG